MPWNIIHASLDASRSENLYAKLSYYKLYNVVYSTSCSAPLLCPSFLLLRKADLAYLVACLEPAQTWRSVHARDGMAASIYAACVELRMVERINTCSVLDEAKGRTAFTYLALQQFS